jgi:hypothetical protein
MHDDNFESRVEGTMQVFNETVSQISRRTSGHIARHTNMHGMGN